LGFDAASLLSQCSYRDVLSLLASNFLSPLWNTYQLEEPHRVTVPEYRASLRAMLQVGVTVPADRLVAEEITPAGLDVAACNRRLDAAVTQANLLEDR